MIQIYAKFDVEPRRHEKSQRWLPPNLFFGHIKRCLSHKHTGRESRRARYTKTVSLTRRGLWISRRALTAHHKNIALFQGWNVPLHVRWPSTSNSVERFTWEKCIAHILFQFINIMEYFHNLMLLNTDNGPASYSEGPGFKSLPAGCVAGFFCFAALSCKAQNTAPNYVTTTTSIALPESCNPMLRQYNISYRNTSRRNVDWSEKISTRFVWCCLRQCRHIIVLFICC
jgi:hypothetical protein